MLERVKHVTDTPLSTSFATSLEPMKPVAPVTNTFNISKSASLLKGLTGDEDTTQPKIKSNIKHVFVYCTLVQNANQRWKCKKRSIKRSCLGVSVVDWKTLLIIIKT